MKLTTQQTIALIKKHKGGKVCVDSKIGLFGCYVAVAKNELISQLTYQFSGVTHAWLDATVTGSDLYITWEEDE